MSTRCWRGRLGKVFSCMLEYRHRHGTTPFRTVSLKLSDKSKQALFWSPTIGYYGAKKPYLAVSSATKTAVEKPSSYVSGSFSR